MHKVYDIDGQQVSVVWQEILPRDGQVSSRKAAVFLPGWPLKGQVRTTHKIGECIADHSKYKTYIFNTFTKGRLKNYSLKKEIIAICKFLEDEEIEHVILSGYSQGGTNAITMASLLQEVRIAVEGLILMESVGLYKMNHIQLILRYLCDLFLISPFVILKYSLKKTSLKDTYLSLMKNVVTYICASIDFLHSIIIDLGIYRENYFFRIQKEIGEIIQLNPYLSQIYVPIVLIQGIEDRVSDYRYMVPQKLFQTRIAGEKGMVFSFQRTGEEKRKNHLFPNSPFLRIIKVRKFGSHLVPFFRTSSIIRASFYLFHRAGAETD